MPLACRKPAIIDGVDADDELVRSTKRSDCIDPISSNVTVGKTCFAASFFERYVLFDVATVPLACWKPDGPHH